MRATDVSTRALNNPKEDIGASTFGRSSGISADMVLTTSLMDSEVSTSFSAGSRGFLPMFSDHV